MKKISLFLAIILLLFSMPFQIFASDNSPELIIKYTIGSDENEQQVTPQIIAVQYILT